jgi:hypothetical protein
MRKASISFLLAALASAWLLFAPTYTRVSARRAFPAAAGTPTRSVQHATLRDVNGPRILFVLAIPVVVAGLPILFRSRAVRILAAALLTGWVAIAAASIGLFYLPSAILMIWSALA